MELESEPVKSHFLVREELVSLVIFKSQTETNVLHTNLWERSAWIIMFHAQLMTKCHLREDTEAKVSIGTLFSSMVLPGNICSDPEAQTGAFFGKRRSIKWRPKSCWGNKWKHRKTRHRRWAVAHRRKPWHSHEGCAQQSETLQAACSLLWSCFPSLILWDICKDFWILQKKKTCPSICYTM